MRHPLLKSNEDVRRRVMSLLAQGLMVRRAGNLIFVCGGNGDTALRPRFFAFANMHLTDFELFQPEFAMTDYFTNGGGGQLDLADFEVLIGELSHAVVIFPEAPGSFAETGYFANVTTIADRTILVMDMDRQRSDSFIMMGPYRKYESQSKYSPNIQIDYNNPDFSIIVDRINRFAAPKNRTILEIDQNIDDFSLFSLIWKIFDILSVATFDDLKFVLRSLMDGHPKLARARDLASILVGAKYLKPVGDFGHYAATSKGSGLVELRVGYPSKESALKIEVNEILRSAEPEFDQLLRELRNVA